MLTNTHACAKPQACHTARAICCLSVWHGCRLGQPWLSVNPHACAEPQACHTNEGVHTTRSICCLSVWHGCRFGQPWASRQSTRLCKATGVPHKRGRAHNAIDLLLIRVARLSLWTAVGFTSIHTPVQSHRRATQTSACTQHKRSVAYPCGTAVALDSRGGLACSRIHTPVQSHRRATQPSACHTGLRSPRIGSEATEIELNPAGLVSRVPCRTGPFPVY